MMEIFNPPVVLSITEDFKLGRFAINGDYANSSVIDPGQYIRTLDQYGFPAGKTLVGDITYRVKGATGATAKARLVILNNNDSITVVPGSEVTTSITNAITSITVTGLSLTLGTHYLVQIGSGSGIIQSFFYGAILTLR